MSIFDVYGTIFFSVIGN